MLAYLSRIYVTEHKPIDTEVDCFDPKAKNLFAVCAKNMTCMCM
jgi:hypothetical protein